MKTITIANVTMPIEAARSVEWAGVDVAADVERVRREGNCDGLLAECLEGCEPEHEGDWRDYVAAVCAAAERADGAPAIYGVPAHAPTSRQVAHWDDLRTVKTDVPAWDFEGFWSVVIGRTPSLCVAEFDLSGDLTAWVNEAAAQAWQAGGQGGSMPEEWAPYIARATEMLQAEAAAECDRVVRSAQAEVAS